MPRHIPGQVTQSVSRLLEGRYLKSPPAWYDATIQHPPTNPPPLFSRERPDSDLPRSMQSSVQRARQDAANKAGRRSVVNKRKKLRSQMPPLRPQPIVYEADRVRRQFFRDHPWEAKRPAILTEMNDMLEEPVEPDLAPGELPELTMWSRINPSVEDVVQCTLKTAKVSSMSLAQAYWRTISSYHAIQAEREHRMRFALLEARYFGADLGVSETERGFMKEARELAKWTAQGTSMHTLHETSEGTPSKRKHRIKRDDTTFTAGNAYINSAQSLSDGQAMPGLDTQKVADASSVKAPVEAPDSTVSDDYLGIGQSLR